jgi:uncharacterized protein YegP (UPF0339 family)
MALEASLGPVAGSSGSQSAADRQFLDQRGPGFASNDSADESCTDPTEARQCHFSIFREDSVSVTSTHFAGGDWRWRLSDQEGAILVEAAGYRSEAHCREAVAILQARSARATVA